MQLSVVIVNYNVRHFLEQCLFSVQKALTGLQGEIIVVDNNSTDNSISLLKPTFPFVKFICNSTNAGFASACNQGYSQSTGKLVLFLNPDCIVPEDCFEKCISFFHNHPDAGAIGVRMLDGQGRFLKESKRAFPSPLTSLYKLVGLARLFPHSKKFARYHLGHLNEKENQVVDVLAGAFLMIKRKVLEITGLFDETFFMYGEDIDLSYRIQQAGFKNYFVANTAIIHFKGESTKKGSLNYVRLFYKAMSVFVHKHYGGSKAGIFNFFIHLAIWARAGLSGISRFLQWIGLPFIDALLIFYSFSFIKQIWTRFVKADINYPSKLLWIAFSAFTIIYLIVSYYAGLYDKQYKASSLIKSTVAATLVLLAGYSLLPEQLRFSRGIVLFGAMMAFVLISALRLILVKQNIIGRDTEKENYPYLLIAGSLYEYRQLLAMLEEVNNKKKVLGRLAVLPGDTTAIAYWKDINQIKNTAPFAEIIFCEGTLGFKEIIETLPAYPKNTRLRFHADGSKSIVGSDSKDAAGESLGHENGFNLSDPYNRRMKRLIDFILAAFFLLIFPIHFLILKHPLRFLHQCIQVLIGKYTWIGYLMQDNNLPPIRPAIISSNGISLSKPQAVINERFHIVDNWYAREYDPLTDIPLIIRYYRQLDK